MAALCTEEGLKSILNGVGEGFYAVDRDWRIILFNNEAARYFRRTPEEVLGRTLWETFPRARETGLGQLFLRTMQSRETIRSETELVIFRDIGWPTGCFRLVTVSASCFAISPTAAVRRRSVIS